MHVQIDIAGENRTPAEIDHALLARRLPYRRDPSILDDDLAGPDAVRADDLVAGENHRLGCDAFSRASSTPAARHVTVTLLSPGGLSGSRSSARPSARATCSPRTTATIGASVSG